MLVGWSGGFDSHGAFGYGTLNTDTAIREKALDSLITCFNVRSVSGWPFRNTNAHVIVPAFLLILLHLPPAIDRVIMCDYSLRVRIPSHCPTTPFIEKSIRIHASMI